jgi:hypothetical protein
VLEDRLAVGTPRAETLELTRGDTSVVLRADVRLPGQLYNVFEIRDGRIAAVGDFVRRRDTLHAAGATEPQWT